MDKRGAYLSFREMSSTDAPTLMGEPLIEVISESVNEPSMSPDLFTPPVAVAPPGLGKRDGWFLIAPWNYQTRC